jgi:hypothetical protein
MSETHHRAPVVYDMGERVKKNSIAKKETIVPLRDNLKVRKVSNPDSSVNLV